MTDTPTDPADLRRRLARGDRQALAELFALHRDRLWRMVNFRLDGRLRSRLSPDDLLQEAYLAAAGRMEHYVKQPFRSEFVWLRMIVHQCLIDTYRKHLGARMRDAGREVAIDGGRFTHTSAASMVIVLTGGLTSPSTAAMRAEQVDRVRDAIDGMGPLDSEVLAMRHFEEMTNQEVAEELGIEPKAASIRYVRALRRLREILGQLPAEEGRRND